MPAVSSTSPLLNLAIVDLLPLLRQQCGELLIPPAVAPVLDALELEAGSHLAANLRQEVLRVASEG